MLYWLLADSLCSACIHVTSLSKRQETISGLSRMSTREKKSKWEKRSSWKILEHSMIFYGTSNQDFEKALKMFLQNVFVNSIYDEMMMWWPPTLSSKLKWNSPALFLCQTFDIMSAPEKAITNVGWILKTFFLLCRIELIINGWRCHVEISGSFREWTSSSPVEK